MMRLFALIALVLTFAAIPASAQAPTFNRTYTSAPNSTPGEPPSAILLMTGLVGVAFVGLKRRSSEE
jgi:hypothetical protein